MVRWKYITKNIDRKKRINTLKERKIATEIDKYLIIICKTCHTFKRLCNSLDCSAI